MKSTIIFFFAILIHTSLAAETLTYQSIDQFKVIEVQISGNTYRAILDSGSNVNVLSNKLELGQTKSEQKVRTSVLTTQTVPVKEVTFQLGQKEYTQQFVALDTKVSNDCCDLILGKPFFDKAPILISISQKKIIIDSPRPKTGTKISLTDSKEIVTECKIDQVKTLCRLDFGSTWAADATGPFVNKQRLVQRKDYISLESMNQPGLGVINSKLSIGPITLANRIPIITHRPGQTALGTGQVGLNIGAPILDTFDIYFDTSNKVVILTPNQQAIRFNKSWSFFTAKRPILVKATHALSELSKNGIFPGDEIKEINGLSPSSDIDVYQIFEDPKTTNFKLKIMRDDEIKNVDFKINSPYLKNDQYVQSHYAYPKIQPQMKIEWGLLDLTEAADARTGISHIEANFCLQQKFNLDVENLEQNTFSTEIKKDKTFTSVDGIQIQKNKIIISKETTPSLSLNCKNALQKIKPISVFKQSLLIQREFEGCGEKLSYQQEIVFYPKISLDKKSLAGLPYYLSDTKTLVPFRWKQSQLNIVIDAQFPTHMKQSILAAIEEWKKVLPFELKYEVKSLSLHDYFSPNTFGIFYLRKNQSGHMFDNSKKFAFTRTNGNPSNGEIYDADIVFRESELFQFQNMLKDLIGPKLMEKPELAKEYQAFYDNKILSFFYHIAMHELGHFFGLRHNFSDKAKSIMDYQENLSISNYDRTVIDALYGSKELNAPLDFQSTLLPGRESFE